MSKGRLEAFSDGVIAIIMTVMVLELRAPHDASLAGVLSVLPVFLSYLLSFIFLGIYWSNHHHLFHAVQHVSGGVLWANLHLLFWLSLIPFGTAWMGTNHFSDWPVALYGVILLFAAVAYFILTRVLLRLHPKESLLATAIGNDFKGKISVVIYVVAVSVAFINSMWACALYVVVAVMWLVPDRRIEKKIIN